MSEFNSVKDLRDYLSTLLAAELGTFANGVQRIWVKPPDPPAGVGTGLECIIEQTPEGKTVPRGNQHSLFNRIWSVTLINFGSNSDLAKASKKIRSSSRLVQFQGRNPRYLPSSEKNYEQIEFFIYDPAMLTHGG